MESNRKKGRRKIRYNFDNPTIPTSPYKQIPYLTSPGITHAELAPINKSEYIQDKITGEARYERNNCKLVLAKGQPIGICGRNLLDIALSELHKNIQLNSECDCETKVKISLIDFAILSKKNVNKKTSLDKFRRVVNNELEALFNARISWKAKRGHYDYRIISGKGIIGGYIVIDFEKKIADYFKNNFIISIGDQRLLSIDNRNANFWSIYHKLHSYSLIPKNIRDNRNDIISIKSLLSSAIDIPDIEKVKNTNRHYRERIIEPLDNVLEKLEKMGWIKFEYCHVKKEPIPIDDPQPIDLPIEEYINLYIKFEILKS